MRKIQFIIFLILLVVFLLLLFLVVSTAVNQSRQKDVFCVGYGYDGYSFGACHKIEGDSYVSVGISFVCYGTFDVTCYQMVSG